MKQRFSVPAVIAAALLASPAHSQGRDPEPAAPIVFVHGAKEGQGITRWYRGECFVITPEHVVFGQSRELNPSPRVYIVIEGGKRVEVGIMPRTSEFAILRVPDDVANDGVCATQISVPRARRVLRDLAPGTAGAVYQR